MSQTYRPWKKKISDYLEVSLYAQALFEKLRSTLDALDALYMTGVRRTVGHQIRRLYMLTMYTSLRICRRELTHTLWHKGEQTKNKKGVTFFLFC